MRKRNRITALAAVSLAAAGLALASPQAAHATVYPAENPSWGKANLLSSDDSDFEAGTGTWVVPAGGNTAVSQDTVHSFLHHYSLKLTAAAAGTQFVQGMGAPGNNVAPAAAGDAYRVSAWVKTGAAVSSRAVTLSLGFRDSAGGFLGRVSATAQTLASSTKWQYVSGTVTAPSGTADLTYPRITEAGVTAGEVLNADEVMITPYRAAVMIGAKDPSTDGSAWTSMNSTVGPSQVDKEFYSGALPGSYSASNCANLPATITCVEAYKTQTTNVASFVASIPAGRNTILVYHQEPEGDYASGATFVSEFEGQANLIRASTTAGNAENVFVADDSSGYNYGTGRAGADCSYTVPAAYTDFYFMDHYMNPVDGGDSETFGTVSQRSEFTNWIGCTGPQGKPVGFGEYGTNCKTGMNPDDPLVATTFAADNSLLEGQVFKSSLNGTAGSTYNLPVADWMYWWYNNTDNCQFQPGASPDGTGVTSQWIADETQNGGGAN